MKIIEHLRLELCSDGSLHLDPARAFSLLGWIEVVEKTLAVQMASIDRLQDTINRMVERVEPPDRGLEIEL